MSGCWFHSWETVKDTGVHRYQQCRGCGRREIIRVGMGHQPVDANWFETGRFTKPPLPIGAGSPNDLSTDSSC